MFFFLLLLLPVDSARYSISHVDVLSFMVHIVISEGSSLYTFTLLPSQYKLRHNIASHSILHINAKLTYQTLSFSPGLFLHCHRGLRHSEELPITGTLTRDIATIQKGDYVSGKWHREYAYTYRENIIILKAKPRCFDHD